MQDPYIRHPMTASNLKFKLVKGVCVYIYIYILGFLCLGCYRLGRNHLSEGPEN